MIHAWYNIQNYAVVYCRLYYKIHIILKDVTFEKH